MENFRQRFARLLAADMMTDRLSGALPPDMIAEIYQTLGDRAEGESHEEWFRRGGRSRRPGFASARLARLAHSSTLPPELILKLDGRFEEFGRLFFMPAGNTVKVHFVARSPDEARREIEGGRLNLVITPADEGTRKVLARLELDRLQMTAEGEVCGAGAVTELRSAIEWRVEW